MKIPIEKIIVSKDNPRQSFDEEGLRRLGESIKAHGQLQAGIVRSKGSLYELVVGERRLRACVLVGIPEFEAEVKDIDDITAMELRLIENTHREDLTDAEKGDAVYSLWANYEKYETFKDVAQSIGFSHGTVLNWLSQSRKLSPRIRDLVSSTDELTNRNIRSLLKYSHTEQEKLAKIIIKKKIPTTKVPEFTKLYDVNSQVDLDELANKVLGIETVTIPKTELTAEQKQKLEEKQQLAKVHGARKKPSKPLTKKDVKKRLGLYSLALESQMKKTDFKFEPVKITHGTGNVKPPTQTIKPTILGTTKLPSEPDWTLCKCFSCPLFGKYCKGRQTP